MHALQVIRATSSTITPHEAAFHSSAEQYRKRASLIRDSISSTTNTQEGARLAAVANELDELAAALEGMRMNRQVSGLIGLARRARA